MNKLGTSFNNYCSCWIQKQNIKIFETRNCVFDHKTKKKIGGKISNSKIFETSDWYVCSQKDFE